MSSKHNSPIASVIGIDIGKNSFHVVGQDQGGAIALRQKWSRGQVESRFANMPTCLIGVEVFVGASFEPQAAGSRARHPAHHGANSSRNALASFKSRVSKPSVNQS